MQRLEYFNAFILGHLNINYIRSKFEMIAETSTNFDIFLISESKTDSIFPNMQFKINGNKLFRRDSNRFVGGGGGEGGEKGLMLCLNEEIPCKLLNYHPIVPNAEFPNEFHQLKPKWNFLGCYKPPTQNDLEFIASVTNIVAFYLQKIENLFIIGDLNMATEYNHLNDLLQICNLTALIKEPTCYHSQNPNCIDHFLTNRKPFYKHCQTFEIGLSSQTNFDDNEIRYF